LSTIGDPATADLIREATPRKIRINRDRRQLVRSKADTGTREEIRTNQTPGTLQGADESDMFYDGLAMHGANQLSRLGAPLRTAVSGCISRMPLFALVERGGQRNTRIMIPNQRRTTHRRGDVAGFLMDR
jgi:hypothetical protein